MNTNFNMLLRKPSFIGSVIVSISTIIYLIWSLNPGITLENAALECTQNIFLLLACVLYGYQYKNTTDNMMKYERGGLMLFCFAILLREFDIHRIGVSPIWKTIEILVRGATLVLFLAYLTMVRTKIRTAWKKAREIITSPMVVLTIIGCIAYLSGWYFDKLIFNIPKNISVLIEETLELNATLLFFLAACTNEPQEKNSECCYGHPS